MTETEIAAPTAEELKNESNTDRMIRERQQRKNKAGAGAPAATADTSKNKGSAGSEEDKTAEQLEAERLAAGEKSPEEIEAERVANLTPEQRELDQKAKEQERLAAIEAEKNKGKSPEEIEAEKQKNEKSKKSREKALNVEIHSLYKEEDESADNKTKDKNSDKNQEVAPEIKQKAAIADEVLADPFLKGYLEVKKNGGDLNEYLNNTRQVDYSKMTPAEIIAADCKLRGITDPKAIEVEVDAFNEMTPRKQDIELNEIKTSLIARDEKEKTRLGLNVAASAKRNNTIVQKFTSEVPELIDGLVGKPIEGHKELTQKDAELLKKAMLNPKFTRPDGTFNTPYLAQIHARALFYEGDLKTAKADGYTAGFDAAMEEVSRPSKDGTSGRASAAQHQKTKAEKIREGIGQ